MKALLSNGTEKSESARGRRERRSAKRRKRRRRNGRRRRNVSGRESETESGSVRGSGTENESGTGRGGRGEATPTAGTPAGRLKRNAADPVTAGGQGAETGIGNASAAGMLCYLFFPLLIASIQLEWK